MDERSIDLVALSKFMALILRHRSDEFGVRLDPQGYGRLDDLLRAIHSSSRWQHITLDDVYEVINQQEKRRFEIQGDRIRAVYGHSLPLEIQYPEVEPPEYLYHGTSPRALERIRVEGLLPAQRQYVHLSATVEAAREVGARHSDRPVVLRIRAREAREAGIPFYQADELIYLVKRVPKRFIEEESESSAISTSGQ
jgi:putative RNA 2'-phosphotransferase